MILLHENRYVHRFSVALSHGCACLNASTYIALLDKETGCCAIDSPVKYCRSDVNFRTTSHSRNSCWNRDLYTSALVNSYIKINVCATSSVQREKRTIELWRWELNHPKM